MRLRYVGDLAVTTVWGATFYRRRWTASHGLSDELALRLADNPTFQADDGAGDDPIPFDDLPAPAPAAPVNDVADAPEPGTDGAPNPKT